MEVQKNVGVFEIGFIRTIQFIAYSIALISFIFLFILIHIGAPLGPFIQMKVNFPFFKTSFLMDGVLCLSVVIFFEAIFIWMSGGFALKHSKMSFLMAMLILSVTTIFFCWVIITLFVSDLSGKVFCLTGSPLCSIHKVLSEMKSI
ncbi:hypothetical protein [Paenibacillus sp. Leaf72]|uniref:hypothetical protein n=1 Tax=Paenibacillus sp. Leaf72 TaxID=1736234 RepID=UPI0006FBFF8E|nr:hypothetical protein [Paenibacillus sp. Leaf72]KQN96913.1 hypothetical protein ASF12_22860 [Paenibacillus sp. Leaf72]